jgi:aminoglycoside/choline kinase family phosphotransferase
MGDHAAFMAPVGIYATEARFFRDELPHSKVRAPRVYWADVDDENFGVILMEDLKRKDVEFCSARTPLTVAQVSSALENLAILHASRWNSEWLSSADWLEHFADPDSKGRAYFSMLGAEVVAGFINQPERRAIIPDELRDPRRSLDLFWGFVAASEGGPQTLLHGDAHVGNVYFDGGRAAMCDWQVAGRGSPAFDVAYFVGSAMSTESRRDAERELVRRYLAALSEAGVDDPPTFDDMWELYRAHMAYGYFAWLTNPEAFQPHDIITETLRRFGNAVMDLDTGAALGVAL